MKILGIHTGHNSSASILINGKVITAIQEERLTRIKNFTGFPKQALDFVLSQSGLSIDDIDKVTYTDVFRITPSIFTEKKAIQSHFSQAPSALSWLELRNYLEMIRPIGSIALKLRTKRRTNELVSYGIPGKKLCRVDHHTAHAASAYYGWANFEKPILILTCDGCGDGLSATVNIGKSGVINRIASIQDNRSIGLIYAMVTLALGMKPNEHEYKLMGMAPYAHQDDAIRVSKIFSSYFKTDTSNPLGWSTISKIPNTYWSYNTLRKDLEFERFDAICGGLQLWIEDFLVDWIRRCIKHTGIHSVALSGGVFMNVKANQRILQMEEVDELFIFPSCGDETNPIGASLFVQACEEGVSDIKPLGPIYWGRSFSESEIQQAIVGETPNYQDERPFDLPSKLEELIHKGEVVARFAGRDEFGARALGNRSILADPSRTDVIRIINDMIKNRDFWMPFACTILAERADDYLINPKKMLAPYMITTFDTTNKQMEIIAGTHPYDGTARPQIVHSEHNPEFHQIISAFEKITGIGALLNTSFNLHGYQIVHTPQDALQVLARSGLNYLAIGPFLVTKQ